MELNEGRRGREMARETKKEPAAIPSLPPAHEVLSFSPKQRTPVT
jgi:hypothetical protein